jgi:hypothetical protein
MMIVDARHISAVTVIFGFATPVSRGGALSRIVLPEALGSYARLSRT